MKFSIYCIGKLKEPYLREGVAEFVKRLQPYGGVTITELPESKLGDKPSPSDKQKALYDEGQRLLKYCNPQSFVVLLDVYGKQVSSEDLANKAIVRWCSSLVAPLGCPKNCDSGPIGNCPSAP